MIDLRACILATVCSRLRCLNVFPDSNWTPCSACPVMQNPVNQLALARNGLLGIVGIMPFLQVRPVPLASNTLPDATLSVGLAAAAWAP